MKRRLAGLAIVSMVGLLASCKEEAPPPPPRAPTIDLFTVDRSEIAPGDSATLSFSVTGADSVELLAESGEPIAFNGNASAGTAAVTPSETSVYVLRATGPGGRAAAFVQVAVGEKLRSVILLAVPPEVDPGGEVDLVWSAQGATSATLVDTEGTKIDVQGSSGVIALTPETSTRYTLTATGLNGASQSASADVRVRPVLDSLELAPGIVNAGEQLDFTWTTRGADTVVITEKTFGELYRTASPAEAASGTVGWIVPNTLPNDGGPLVTGFRLEFTVTVSSVQGDLSATRTVVRHLGEGPVIHLFTAPEFATPGNDVVLSWNVTGADRLQIYANGLLVSEPRATDPIQLEKGTVKLPAGKLDTTYRLVATGFDGASASASADVTVTAPPEILGFNLSRILAQVGDAATASWSTANASMVKLRIKNGPVVFSTSDKGYVAQGTAAVYPGRTTVYVLDAINAAGAMVSAEATVTVGSPADVTYSPASPLPGDAVTVSWNFPAGDTLEVIGIPRPTAMRNVMSAAYVDLVGAPGVAQLEFANGDDDVAELPASAAFQFPLLGAMRSRFVASTNGFLAFEPTQALPGNVALSTQARLPAMVAPFWDDLELGSGHVLYRVDGTQFPRRLIVQWSQVALKDKAGSRLDFQVHLYETGEARFLYKQLDDGAGGPADASATIGVHAGALFSGQHSANAAGAVGVDDELIWFNSTEVAGSFTVPLYSSRRFSFFYRRMNGDLINVSLPVSVWGKGLLTITEAMPQPIAPVNGQWLEIENTSNDEVSLSGARLIIGSAGEVLLPDVTLAPAQVLVVGQSADKNENGGVDVDEVFPELSLAAVDTVELAAGYAYVSKLEWSASTLGESIERDQQVLDSAGATKVCPRLATYGADGAKGTPGQKREACWNYKLEAIAFNPQDIMGSGEVLFQKPTSGREWKLLPLTQRPFPMFGAEYEEGLVSANGFISFVYTPGTVSDYYSYGNEKRPGLAIPNAAAVPFGDMFELTRADSLVLFRRVEAGEVGPGSVGHWVAQWHRGSHYYDANADTTFQAKLFDDGVIEFHYGAMLDGTNEDIHYGQGEDATSWVENADGTEALAINVFSLTPGIQSYSAFRFTPVQ